MNFMQNIAVLNKETPQSKTIQSASPKHHKYVLLKTADHLDQTDFPTLDPLQVNVGLIHRLPPREQSKMYLLNAWLIMQHLKEQNELLIEDKVQEIKVEGQIGGMQKYL